MSPRKLCTSVLSLRPIFDVSYAVLASHATCYIRHGTPPVIDPRSWARWWKGNRCHNKQRHSWKSLITLVECISTLDINKQMACHRIRVKEVNDHVSLGFLG
jgi:hypothetical protein